MIVLEAGDWRAGLNPGLGGSIANLSWRGRPVLRPTPPDAEDMLRTACFPLLPYANRIARGRFVFDGQTVDIGPTPGFEPHALHGLGWRRPWRIEAADPISARLALEHAADAAWPWAFRAEQVFHLRDDGLSVTVALTNTDDSPAPAGVGLHPYLDRRPQDRLTLDAPRVWVADERLIPTALGPAAVVFDWRDGPRVADAPFVDNAYDGWDGTARLSHGDWSVGLSAPGVSRAHVYAPLGADFVCVEPVSHRPDALNAPADEASGMATLQPGQTLSLFLTVSAA